MTYRLGAKSNKNLVGVHPDLILVVRKAITLTHQDFSVHEGVRTKERQKRLFDKGVSKIDGITKIGRHQIGKDGFGHAVDLVPYIDGELRWEWNLIFNIADAVKQAAIIHDVPIRWGGAWKIITAPQYKGMLCKDIYKENPSWDGAHFELPSSEYP